MRSREPLGSGLRTDAILTLNAGSSSLKFSLFSTAPSSTRILEGVVRRVGRDSTIALRRQSVGHVEETVDAPDHRSALEAVLTRLERGGAVPELVAVGHRIVHGGARYDSATRITPEVIVELHRLSALDPDHLPAEIAIIEAMRARAPSLVQVACFDTAFHSVMPRVARLLPIPRRYEADGVRRYGFHGISYAFLIEELTRLAGDEVASGRVVLAHLGSGASLAAVHGRRCVDTTMSFTPNSGIPMSTRSGDLDPGVVLHLMRSNRLSVDEVDELLSRRSGLLGVSETSPDMHDLLESASHDPRAEEAVALFCYRARQAIGALAATLGGLDTLVFSGGIGENAPLVRARIVRGLEHLGVRLDPMRNDAGAKIISTKSSRCTLRVIPTDEESIIARETRRILICESGEDTSHGSR